MTETDPSPTTAWRGRLPVWFEAPPEPHGRIAMKIDEHTTPRQLVLRTMFADPRRTVPASFLVIGHQVGEALVPIVMGLAIDRGVATGDATATIGWIAVLGLVFGMLSFCFRFGSRIGFLGMQSIQHELRTRVTERILAPRGMSGLGHTPGMALNIATADVTRLATGVAAAIYPLGQIAAVILCGVVLLWISWPLGVVVLLGAPAILWVLDRAGGPLRARSENEQQLAGEAAGSAADLVAGFRVIKGIGAEAEAARRYRDASGRALTAVVAARRSQGTYLGAMEAITALFVVCVGVAAGVQTVRGALTVGELITVVGLTQFIMAPMSALATNFGQIWVTALASSKRVLSILQAPPAVRAPAEVPAPFAAGPVVVDGVPVGSGRVSIDLPESGVTVLVTDAETRTDLVSILSRSHEPENGSLRVGGTDLFDLDEASALRTIRVAPHDGALFEGSVEDNVAAAIPDDADDREDRLTRALFASVCEDVIDVLPDGLDTSVGEAGKLLSGGQRQRVALARALAAETSTLVLVDPTNAVDSVTETVIAERLATARSGRSTVVFTHSPSLMAVADTIVSISVDGEVRTRNGAAVSQYSSVGAAAEVDR
ncbi:ABC transporter transmembrane domain-containing protein [Gordonia soli]|uniref:Putative ABC transporter permease/ATP-binding protein n=1 Tax=Gordonia soli NBRC 108243 TaxID=1223545 RepID=M0QQE8_9ACTN|nr:ABC transporter ATP-binding protein [Gordonia soli]GAC70885.1 putative ABC transporter permease/ATP-binding protein [Gordonia soli NBRC 108243]